MNLPRNRRFVVPRNLKLLAVPLSRIQESSEVGAAPARVSLGHSFPTFVGDPVSPKILSLQVYGPVISLIPELLSEFSFNRVRI